MKLKFIRKNNRYVMKIFLPKGEIEKDVTEFIEGEIQREVNERLAIIKHKNPPIFQDIDIDTADAIMESEKWK